jgi:hypothetical protein
MKKTKIIYWIFTALFAAFMLFSAIPDIMNTKEAQDLVGKQLGYPMYIIPFIGVAKLLGAIAILVPGFPKLKEWAYAGFTIDLLGAWYSGIAAGLAAGMPAGQVVGPTFFMLLPIGVMIVSYIYLHKLQKLKGAPAGVSR